MRPCLSRQKRWVKFVGPILIVSLLILSGQEPAFGVQVADYSYAGEFTQAGAYTGSRLYRFDNQFNLPGTNCDDSFTYPVTYQAQWAIITPDAQNWIELGTGHKCFDYRFWYWGFGIGGSWFPQGTSGNRAVDAHTFRISRTWNGGNPEWSWYVDLTLIGSIYWNTGAARLEAGLESHESTTVASPHGYQSLAYQVYDMPWQNWSGQDGATVQENGVPSGPPAICGRWYSPTDWRASQNWGSC